MLKISAWPWLPRLKLTPSWRNSLLAVSGGILAAMAFPNPIWIGMDWPGGFLAFFCLIPLLAIREPRGPKASWRWGFLFGFIYFGIALAWMPGMKAMFPLGILTWLLLAGYLAVYPALFLAGYHFLIQRGISRSRAAITLWVALEFARNYVFTGFPWVALGYAHFRNPLLMSLAPVAGVWGLTFATVLVNVLGYELLARLAPQKMIGETRLARDWLPAWVRMGWLPLVVLILVAGAVFEKNNLRKFPGQEPFAAAVLQGNINQDQAWTQAYVDNTFSVYHRLLLQAQQQQARLAVWPETAFPGIFNYDHAFAELVRHWSRTLRMSQLVGSDEVEILDPSRCNYYNSLFLLDENGNIAGRTSKVHLVPFGEYVPFKNSVLYFVDKLVRRYGGAGFTPGKQQYLLPWQNHGQAVPIGAMICFEGLFPQYAARLCRLGSELLVLVTYDTWYGKTAAPAQHAIFSALRAAENGRYLLRAGTTGISAIFGPSGKCLGQIALDQEGLLVKNVRPRTVQTLYTRFGNWICWICLIVLCLDFLPVIVEKIRVLKAPQRH